MSDFIQNLPLDQQERAGFLALDLDLIERAPKSLLDMGTGSGCMVAVLLNKYPDLGGVLVDSVHSLKHLDALPDTDRERFSFVKWPYGDGLDGQSFDLVMSIDVLEHIPNWKLAIDELTGHVAPGGHLYIQTPSDHPSPNYPRRKVMLNRALGIVGRNQHYMHVRDGLSCKAILDQAGTGFEPLVASESYVLNGEVPCSFKPRTHLLLKKTM